MPNEKTVVLLNALVPPPWSEGIMVIKKVTLEEAKAIVGSASAVVSFIGHEATARALSQALGIPVATNRGMYSPEEGHIVLVFRLPTRSPTPGAEKGDVRPEDLEVLLVKYIQL